MHKFLLPSILGVIGFILALLAVILGWVVVPNVIEKQIEKEVQLIPGSDTYEKWEVNPFPAYIAFWIFNLTDPTVMDRRETPRFEEFGPFVYEELRVKHDATINETDDTVSYVQRITYIFREELSNGSVYDPVFTVINTPFLIVSQAIYEALGPAFADLLIDAYLVSRGETFIRTGVSVNDLIFDGVPLIDSYAFILSFLAKPPPEFADNRFAFYRGKNGSHDGEYKIKRGVHNPNDFGKVVTWENQTMLNWWKSPTWLNSNKEEDRYCNYINGTDGSVFPPFVKKTDLLNTFVTDICRSMVLQYEKDVEHRGVPGYRFVLPPSFYEDPEIDGDNYCFCTSPPGDLINRCGKGIIRLFPCKDGAPIVVSSPHFLYAGQEFLDLGREMGLNPDIEKHQTRVDLEPNTGVTLSVAKKLQVSMEIQSLTNVAYFTNLTHMVFPIFWANEYADIDDKLSKDIKSQLLTPLKIVNISKWSVLAVGGILLIASGVVFYIAVRTRRNEKH